MFCRGFSFDLVTRVWDVFFHEGYKIVYRVALALVKSIERELLDSSFEDILGVFRSIPKLVDAGHLMDSAWLIPLKTAEIEKFEKKFTETKAKEMEEKEKEKIERERKEGEKRRIKDEEIVKKEEEIEITERIERRRTGTHDEVGL
jgi:hypothetical protein